MTDAKNETFKKDCETLIKEIKASQAEKKAISKKFLKVNMKAKNFINKELLLD